ncbi:MAG: glycosyltransferase family 2 protein, partial [Candidatus Woesearchaeota archaeon]
MNPILSFFVWTAICISLYFSVFWLLVFIEGDVQTRQRTTKLKRFPYISVVVPAFNEETHITETLHSLLNLDYPKKRLEIIVVDDGSTDRTAEMVQSIARKFSDRKIKLIRKVNGGKGSALNAGLKKAKGELFVCMDADSIVLPDALRKALIHFEPDVAAVLPLLKVKNPKAVVQKMQWFEYLINMFYKKLLSKLNCIHVAPGPFSVYRTAVLKEVGGFDEHNLTEDLEMTLRLQSK